jgi:hypothetical protein
MHWHLECAGFAWRRMGRLGGAFDACRNTESCQALAPGKRCGSCVGGLGPRRMNKSSKEAQAGFNDECPCRRLSTHDRLAVSGTLKNEQLPNHNHLDSAVPFFLIVHAQSHDQHARNNNIRHGFGPDCRQDRSSARGQHLLLSGILSAKDAAGEGR